MDKKGHLTFEKGHLIFGEECVRTPRTPSDTPLKSIENKRSSSFIKFDIVGFYPSITKDLFTKSINYAKSITTIEEEVITTIVHARKSLLFDKTSV